MRIRQPICDHWKWILGFIGIVGLCAGYQFLSYRQHIHNPTDTTIPNLGQLWDGIVQACTPHENALREAFGIDEGPETKSLWADITGTWLFRDSFATYGRLVKGLGWGCLISVITGVLMGCFEWLAALLMPPLALLAKIPGTAMLAVFFVMVGTGENMFIAMIGFGILPTLTQSIYLSAKNELHEEEINKAYTLGASNFEVIWNVVVPQTLPHILDAIRLQIGPAMVYLIAAEMLVGQVGMGYQIRMQQRLMNMAVVYDYLLILGLSGLLMDRGMNFLRGKLCPWYERLR